MEGTAEFRAAEGALWLRNGTEVGTTQCKRKWDSPALLASQPISVGHSRSIESVLMALRDAKAVGSEPSSKKHQQECPQICEDLQTRHEGLRRRVAAARSTRRELCSLREALIARNTAMAALCAQAVAACRCPATRAAPPPSAADDPLLRPPAGDSGVAETVGESNRRSSRDARSRRSGPAEEPVHNDDASVVFRCPWSVPHASVPIDTVYAHPPSAPRKISPSTHLASIAFQDLLEASGSQSASVDFSCVGMQAMLTKCQDAKLLDAGVVATGDVCWFIQLGVAAAPGLELSLSSALRTPECVASAVLYFLLAALEGALTAAALESFGGTSSGDSTPRQDQIPRRQQSADAPSGPALSRQTSADRREPGLSPTTSPSGAADDEDCACSSGTPTSTVAQHAQHAQHAADSAVPQALRERMSAGAQHARWSGAVRCGVNEAASAQHAVWRSVRALVARFWGTLPRDVVDGILSTARASLSPIVSFFTPGREEAAAAADGGGEGPVRQAGQEAATGVLAMVCCAYDHLRTPSVLAALGSDSGAGGATEAHVRGRAHVAAVMLSACHVLTLRDAPRTVRRLVVSGVLPNFFEHKDLHIALFHSMRLSSAQRRRCAEHWHAWQKHRSDLDCQLHRALAAMPSVLHAGRAIAAVQSTLSTPPHTFPTAPPSHPNSATDINTLRHPEVSASALRFTVDRGFAALPASAAPADPEHGPPLQPVPEGSADVDGGGGAVCSATSEGWGMWGPHTAAVAELLLGCSIERTTAAGAALGAVRAVHAADAGACAVAAAARTQPGALLAEEQIAQVWAARAMHGATPVDVLELCQLAALHQSRERTHEILRCGLISDMIGCGM